ncbi:hypothetical protein FRC04_005659 [Tulasnella sp. 424]|nr:hypothetical protein FRC04_005659 [Tulasnella sp. 424]
MKTNRLVRRVLSTPTRGKIVMLRNVFSIPTARQRRANQGTVGAKKFTPVRTWSKKSAQDVTPESKRVNPGQYRAGSEDDHRCSYDLNGGRCCHCEGTESLDVEQSCVEQRRGCLLTCGYVVSSRRGHARDNTLDTNNPPVDQKTGTEGRGDIVFTGEFGSLKKKQCSGSSDDSQKNKRFLGLSRSISSNSKGGHKNVASKSTGRTGLFTEEPIGEAGEFQVSSPDSDDRLDERDDSVGIVDRVWMIRGVNGVEIRMTMRLQVLETNSSSPEAALLCWHLKRMALKNGFAPKDTEGLEARAEPGAVYFPEAYD